MFIDAHVHIHPAPDGFGKRYDASVGALIRSMEGVDIEKAIVLPIAPDVSNDFIYESCSRYPEKLIGFASTPIMNNNNGYKELFEEIEKYKLKGIKLHPRKQKIGQNDYEGVLWLAREASAKGLPIMIDSFPYGDTLFTDRSLELIDSLAGDLPKAKIILPHAGGIRILEAYLVARYRPNIILDFSFILLYFKNSSIIINLEFILKNLGSDRFVYGSDFPLVDLNNYYLETVGLFERLGFTDRQAEDIFKNNIMKILNV